MQNKIILPPSTIGIIGGEKSGEIMAEVAQNLGYKVLHAKDVSDIESLKELVAKSDIITYATHAISYKTIRKMEQFNYLPQTAMPLVLTSHRLRELLAIDDSGFQVAPFLAVMSRNELKYAIKKLGYPARLKISDVNYNGPNKWVIRDVDDLVPLLTIPSEYECVLEGVLDFPEVIGLAVTRNVSGDVIVYPKIDSEAEQIAIDLIKALEFVGTYVVKLRIGDTGIYVEKLSPYPTSICPKSQFEQHIRAICGLPLGNVPIHAGRRTE